MYIFSSVQVGTERLHTCVSCIDLHTYVCVSAVVFKCVLVNRSPSGRIPFSPGRWGNRRRCYTCLCSLRGPSLRPAAHTPRRPRPNAGSHCWRRSRNSDRRPERWRWLLPVARGGQTHRQLEHEGNQTNTRKGHRHLLNSSTAFLYHYVRFSGRLIINYWQPSKWDTRTYDITSAFMLDKLMDCDLWPPPRPKGRTENTTALAVIDQPVLTAGPTMGMWLGCGDKRNHWGQQVVHGGELAQPRNSITIYWPVAGDAAAGSVCMILSCYAEARQFHICMLCVGSLLLTQQQWISTYLLAHLIRFTHRGRLSTHAWIATYQDYITDLYRVFNK